ncbi:hypothetical protein Q5425_41355 [Amycolatopsis sp. A133]|uniref:hypothetical protein n=1 Tax=Amycolatopsis sp. A133 TaxID=3064472 RepID=UPI0027F13B96|nr:hypothetical protein [Amycolatopsis sp. A133]MDQ7810211.1 hypothetical protein [Amycolatopsis sp. A133]
MPGPPARDTRSLLLRGAGLVAIAVVSGLLWFLIRHGSATDEPVAQPPAQNTGQFKFTKVAGPEKSADCAAKSYGDTKDFFTDSPCRSLVRALYTAESGGAKALVSVVVVGMPDSTQAKALKALTEKDGTGNVTDLVKDKTFAGTGTPSVSGSDAAYASTVDGTNTTIVLADFYDKHKDKNLIERIADDALRLSSDLHS